MNNKYNYMKRDKKKATDGDLNTLGLLGWEAYAVDEKYIYLKAIVGV